MRGARLLLLVGALAVAVCGCGDEPDPPAPAGDGLTVYASMPSRGPAAAAGEAVRIGMRRALASASGRAGGRRVRLVTLPSTPAEGEPRAWDPGMVEANAERAVEDPTAVAYIGELERGGSAVSLPVTNAAGMLQVSPADGLTSLTRRPPGAPRSGPERYYPGELRTFVRLVPPDLESARELVDTLAAQDMSRVVLLYGDEISDHEFESMVTALAGAPPPIELDGHPLRDLDPERAADLLERVVAYRPDAIVLAGGTGAETDLMLAALGARLPDVPLFAAPALAPTHERRRVPSEACAFTGVPTAAQLPPRGRRLLASLERDAGRELGVEALLGYEALALALDAIAEGGSDRAAVARAARAEHARSGPLGEYGLGRRGDVEDAAVSCVELVAGG